MTIKSLEKRLHRFVDMENLQASEQNLINPGSVYE